MRSALDRTILVVLVSLGLSGCASTQSPTTSSVERPSEETTRGAEESTVSSDPPRAESRKTRGLRNTQRVFEYVAGGTLFATASLGLLVFGNQPTSYGDGRCISGDPHFGSYGCDALSTLHGVLGVSAGASYLSAGVMSFTLPEAPPESPPSAFESILTPAHAAGVALTPALGIVAREPEVVGIDAGPNRSAPRTIRTIHAGVAVTTVVLYAASYFVD